MRGGLTTGPKEHMERLYENINAHDLDRIVASVAADFVDHEEFVPGQEPGRDGARQAFGAMLEAFPDLRFEIDDMLVDGDKAVARFHMRGTNTGSFMGMPPTGRPVDVQAIDIVRFRGDAAVEHWGVTDSAKMMQDLGLAPPPT